jgi:hypothetical protein
MRADVFTLWALLGLAGALTIDRRDPQDEEPSSDASEEGEEDDADTWKPKTKDPHFFNLKIDDACHPYADPPQTDPADCQFEDFAIRLEKGIVIATPYNKWWDPKLPTFFVDDDTQLYTVSKDPLQVYVDAVTGAVKYTKVGWLPPSAIATSFYHTGNNPLQLVDPSPSYLTWPSTYGIAQDGEWAFCPLGETGQFQVFVNNDNFASQGVAKDFCEYYQLAAVNANPWKKDVKKPQGGPDDYEDDDADEDEE